MSYHEVEFNHYKSKPNITWATSSEFHFNLFFQNDYLNLFSQLINPH